MAERGAAIRSAETAALSDAWRRRFALIDTAGGPKLPNLKQLSSRQQIQLSSNLLGFLFGPFFYLAKGMWRKALTLTVVAVIASFAVEFAMRSVGVSEYVASSGSSMVGAALFAMRANIDYYKHVRLGNRDWL